jgi:hypothetical protein
MSFRSFNSCVQVYNRSLGIVSLRNHSTIVVRIIIPRFLRTVLNQRLIFTALGVTLQQALFSISNPIALLSSHSKGLICPCASLNIQHYTSARGNTDRRNFNGK